MSHLLQIQRLHHIVTIKQDSKFGYLKREQGHFLQRMQVRLVVPYQSSQVRAGSWSYWTGCKAREGCWAFPSVQQQPRSLLRSCCIHTGSDTHTEKWYTHTHVSLSPAGERSLCPGRVMAQHAMQSYPLSDEQEYLQAYEDVLEKYKGNVTVTGCGEDFECCRIAVWQRNSQHDPPTQAASHPLSPFSVCLCSDNVLIRAVQRWK